MHTVKEWTRPDSYFGAEWHGWFSAGFGQSRDSDALEESNFQTAYPERLSKPFKKMVAMHMRNNPL